LESGKELQILIDSSGELSPVARLADIPEEDIWLAKQKSKRTRRAYKRDVEHFMRTLMIRSYDELRQVDHHAVIAWGHIMREIDNAEPSTILRQARGAFQPLQASQASQPR
jgi:hypothetical protein